MREVDEKQEISLLLLTLLFGKGSGNSSTNDLCSITSLQMFVGTKNVCALKLLDKYFYAL